MTPVVAPAATSAAGSASNPPLYKKETVCLTLKATEKEAIIDEMIVMLNADGVLNDTGAFKEEIMKRESVSSTAFGGGIVIPHAKTSAVKVPRVAVGLSKKGFSYDSFDGELVHMIFMIAVGDGEADEHLKHLSALSQKLMEPAFTERLKQCSTEQEVVALLSQE